MSNKLTNKDPKKINVYREHCRLLVSGHPKLNKTYKYVLMRMIDYVNRYTYEAFVGEKTLANDCATNLRHVQRAKEAGVALGILKRTKKGNQFKARWGNGPAAAQAARSLHRD